MTYGIRIIACSIRSDENTNHPAKNYMEKLKV